MIQNRTTITN